MASPPLPPPPKVDSKCKGDNPPLRRYRTYQRNGGGSSTTKAVCNNCENARRVSDELACAVVKFCAIIKDEQSGASPLRESPMAQKVRDFLLSDKKEPVPHSDATAMIVFMTQLADEHRNKSEVFSRSLFAVRSKVGTANTAIQSGKKWPLEVQVHEF